MKVGDLLSDEVKNIPRLKYPLKILKDKSPDTFSENEVYESQHYVNHCKLFISEILKDISPKKAEKNLLPKLQDYNFGNNSDSDKQIFLKLRPKRVKSCIKKDLYKLSSIDNSTRKKNNSRLQSGRAATLKNENINKIFPKNNNEIFLTLADDTDSERKNLQKLFDLRFERKFKLINNITHKLNNPLFLFRSKDSFKEKVYNKSDTIKKFYRF